MRLGSGWRAPARPPAVSSHSRLPLLLALGCSALYLAASPGSFFSVDEVVVLESARSVLRRGTLEVPATNTAVEGRGGGRYAHRAPALGYVALPLVALGERVDAHHGSLAGGTAAGPPRETLKHPLRWGGRNVVFGALATSAAAGGAIVGLLFLLATRLGAGARAALAFAVVCGLATPLLTESTHFFQHPLETLYLLLGFWALVAPADAWLLRPFRTAALGGTALALAFLARPNAAPAAAAIAIYGALACARARRVRAPPPDRAATALAVSGLALPLVAAVMLTLAFNWIQFGRALDFGYHAAREDFALDPARIARALAGYVAAPSLSIFLFAPPLLLLAFSLRRSFARRRLETGALLAAAAAHLALLTTYGVWHGDLSYGPRLMLAAIVLLLPLTLPVFERALGPAAGAPRTRRRARAAVAAVLALGLLVQVLGIAVDVGVNELVRTAAGTLDDGAWVFHPASSPVHVHARYLLAGKSLAPWALRVLGAPGPGLLVLACLLAVLAASILLLVRAGRRLPPDPDPGAARTPGPVHGESAIGGPDRASPASFLPRLVAIGSVLLVAAGFARTHAITEPVGVRVSRLHEQAQADVASGFAVAAASDYALLLGLAPHDVRALAALAALKESAGLLEEARVLRERALQADPRRLPEGRRSPGPP